jgi:hypothetical protein
MAGVSSVGVLRDIQTLFDIGTASGLTDRELLDRFVNRHDAAARVYAPFFPGISVISANTVNK